MDKSKSLKLGTCTQILSFSFLLIINILLLSLKEKIMLLKIALPVIFIINIIILIIIKRYKTFKLTTRNTMFKNGIKYTINIKFKIRKINNCFKVNGIKLDK